jgi:non-ribosomal peptide synthetase component F
MFVATLPYRIQLDPHQSFEQLIKQVRDQCLSILEHSHYPLQHILADAHHHQSTAAFLETVFDFVSLSSNINRLTLNETQLEAVPLPAKDSVAKFDFMLTLIHDPSSTNNTLSCSLICSSDIFDQQTVQILLDRFSTIVEQLFGSVKVSKSMQPLYKLSIIQPDELRIIRELDSIDKNEQPRFISTIGELFSQEAANHPQKIAVELDEQCLTYSELVAYAQRLALHLLTTYDLKVGEIVCQCMERSLSMVSRFSEKIYRIVKRYSCIVGDWYDVD